MSVGPDAVPPRARQVTYMTEMAGEWELTQTGKHIPYQRPKISKLFEPLTGK